MFNLHLLSSSSSSSHLPALQSFPSEPFSISSTLSHSEASSLTNSEFHFIFPNFYSVRVILLRSPSISSLRSAHKSFKNFT
ncbi:hypothetical protein QVD17_35567 [Tagetes erecta]|uniref:Uncharacterized protein n=1 Tax=Tagetes erecta TaxID=13708 RepID=A0AAD8JZQ3_TARER|nr:hypothetical protein QVD17_35567 [Tagetes erecta]